MRTRHFPAPPLPPPPLFAEADSPSIPESVLLLDPACPQQVQWLVGYRNGSLSLHLWQAQGSGGTPPGAASTTGAEAGVRPGAAAHVPPDLVSDLEGIKARGGADLVSDLEGIKARGGADLVSDLQGTKAAGCAEMDVDMDDSRAPAHEGAAVAAHEGAAVAGAGAVAAVAESTQPYDSGRGSGSSGGTSSDKVAGSSGGNGSSGGGTGSSRDTGSSGGRGGVVMQWRAELGAMPLSLWALRGGGSGRPTSVLAVGAHSYLVQVGVWVPCVSVCGGGTHSSFVQACTVCALQCVCCVPTCESGLCAYVVAVGSYSYLM